MSSTVPGTQFMAQVRAKAATRTCAMTMRTWFGVQYAVHQPPPRSTPTYECTYAYGGKSGTATLFNRAEILAGNP